MLAPRVTAQIMRKQSQSRVVRAATLRLCRSIEWALGSDEPALGEAASGFFDRVRD
jgi:hypothetical protein